MYIYIYIYIWICEGEQKQAGKCKRASKPETEALDRKSTPTTLIRHPRPRSTAAGRKP